MKTNQAPLLQERGWGEVERATLPIAMSDSPLPPDTPRYLDAALAACRRAGEIHRAHFRDAALRVEMKGDASPVTVADRASEEAIRETLHGATPELGLLGEEFGQ